MTELEARGLKKRFSAPGRPEGDGELEVLCGVDIVLESADSLAILGVSGAGKSTLLHILGGLESPSEGSVLYRGVALHELAPAELARFRNRTIGFVFQFHHLLPEFSAEENVMLPCLIGGMSRAEARERAQRMLAAVKLTARAEHRPGKLSGGERQRVAIARALVLEPPVVLADEPTGNLDPHTAGTVEDLLFDLNQRMGTALVLVTHNEALANRLAKKAYLVEGKLES
jgi:lipoprotein-releasing system ATP-binding protein